MVTKKKVTKKKTPSAPKLKAVPRAKQPPCWLWTLEGGPWAGIWARIPGKTLVFRLGEFHGRYVKGVWENV